MRGVLVGLCLNALSVRIITLIYVTKIGPTWKCARQCMTTLFCADLCVAMRADLVAVPKCARQCTPTSLLRGYVHGNAWCAKTRFLDCYQCDAGCVSGRAKNPRRVFQLDSPSTSFLLGPNRFWILDFRF